MPTSHYTGFQDVPYRAMMDDSHYLDEAAHKFWVQGSYPLNSAARCSQHDPDLCLMALDSQSGRLLSTKSTNFTVYKYAQAPAKDGTLLVWVFGFSEVCKHPYNDFAFAKLSLDTAQATLIACMDRNITLHMDEWITSFSADDTLMATGSGNAETADPQLLVLDTRTGHAVVNSKLEGLADALKAEFHMIEIWSVDFF